MYRNRPQAESENPALDSGPEPDPDPDPQRRRAAYPTAVPIPTGADEAYDIACAGPVGAAEPSDDRIIDAVRRALRAGGVAKARVSVAIVGDDEMARLHQQYLGKPGPTDVLTFDLTESAGDSRTSPAERHEGLLEGEIVVSIDTAARVAAERGHEPASEVLLYAVHGALHLTGWDDHDPDEASAMHALEDRLLTELGVGRVFGGDAE